MLVVEGRFRLLVPFAVCPECVGDGLHDAGNAWESIDRPCKRQAWLITCQRVVWMPLRVRRAASRAQAALTWT